MTCRLRNACKECGPLDSTLQERPAGRNGLVLPPFHWYKMRPQPPGRSTHGALQFKSRQYINSMIGQKIKTTLGAKARFSDALASRLLKPKRPMTEFPPISRSHGVKTDFVVYGCSRKVGWEYCGNKHACENQAVFFANTREYGVCFFCEDCADWARKFGMVLHRII